MTKRTKKERNKVKKKSRCVLSYINRRTEYETQVRKQEKEKNCRRYTAWNVNKKGKLMRGAA